MPGVMRLLPMVLALVGLLVLVLAVLAVVPLAPRGLTARPRPAQSYAESLDRIRALEARDGADVRPDACTHAYLHGAKTARAIVFLHGLTNGPAQFDSLARLAFARGDNVLVPRLPRHGLADRMTTALAGLTAGELCEIADASVDAAQGLGDHVTVMGLSVGGALAAWSGQERVDVDRVVLVAPMLGIAVAPGPLGTLATRAAAALPNAFLWWDPRQKEALKGPAHVYPRFATRAIAATLEVAARVRADASLRAPGVRSVSVITLDGDLAVDNAATAALVRAWRAHGVADLRTYAFPRNLHLNHDLVDPEQVGANPALTYPVLLAALDSTAEARP